MPRLVLSHRCQDCGGRVPGNAVRCRTCYDAWRRAGGHRGELAARFWPKVDQSAGLFGCWPWLAFQHGGYGRVETDPGKSEPAHRIAYRLLVGPIPEGLELDHLCRNTICCNPAHLEPVTGAENKRRAALSREAATACRRGHPYAIHGRRYPRTARGHGGWQCLACMASRQGRAA